MKCIFRTRGEPPRTSFTLTLTGTLSMDYGYVTVNNTKYYTARSLTLEPGTEISVYVGGSALSGQKITYNGAYVGSASLGNLTYTFALTADTTVTMSNNGKQPFYYMAAITTS